ncbi:MAG: tetratricopeptide repeat protein [Pirellulales bacterium]|nr:tetratricopeptide repeat protein [Pirellulales bacterium]
MRLGQFVMILAVGLGMAAPAGALDTVRLGKTPLAGQITGMTAQQVTLDRQTGSENISVDRITAVYFEGEPPALNLARVAVANGRFEDAQEILSKIDASALPNRYVVEDVEYYKALCAARLALGGKGTIREAGGQMARFVANYRDSYHWYEANELVGDLLVANRQFAAAVKYYAVVGSAPWPRYKMRSDVAVGRALLAEGKTADALAAFDKVLAAAADPQSEEVRQLAQLGKARCLAEQGQTDQAVQLVQEILAKSDPENAVLNAQAYNALGAALRKAQKTQDALLAFLHVHLLYFSSGEDHAEALANLAELWNDTRQPQRAAEARELLKQRYPNSRWVSP